MDWRDSPWQVFKVRLFVVAVMPWARPTVRWLARHLPGN